MRSKEEYFEKLRSMKFDLYLRGEKIENPVDHPQIRTAAAAVGFTMEYAQRPENQDSMTVKSPLTGKKIHRWTHLYQDPNDMVARIALVRAMCQEIGPCVQRCVGIDGLHVFGVLAHEAQAEFHTDYYDRFIEYAKWFQDNDIVAAGSVTDARGDRSLRPHQQLDPDMYVHVVKKNKDGIVVRGAKLHNSMACVADELIVVPGRGLTKEESDWAVAFATPADAPGIRQIVASRTPATKRKIQNPLTTKYALIDSMTIFDDVFVPWDRVFLCGEWQVARKAGPLFGNYHRHTHCGCIPARADWLVGATSLIAKYTGIRDKEHVRSKILDLAMVGEIVYACGLAASLSGTAGPSGIWEPNFVYSNIGKYYSGTHIAHEFESIYDIAGGILTTLPPEEDYFNPVTHGYMEKYLKGVADVPTEDRIKLLYLLRDLVASGHGATWLSAGIVGAGSPEAQKLGMAGAYPFAEKEEYIKRFLNIQ